MGVEGEFPGALRERSANSPEVAGRSEGCGDAMILFLRIFGSNRGATVLEFELHRKGAMEVFVEHLGSVQFEIKTRHPVLRDQPARDGGFDEGMSSLVSLGLNAALCTVEYLRERTLAEAGTRVHVVSDRALDNFQIEVDAPVSLTAGNRRRVREAVQSCLIHKTKLDPTRVDLTITSPEQRKLLRISAA